MSEQPTNNNTQNKEVDIITLMNYFVNGVKTVFKGLVKLFSYLFDFIILFLFFVRKHIIALTVVTAIGAVIGYFVEKDKGPYYEATMFVKPNYSSNGALLTRLAYLNTLIVQDEHDELANELDIDTTQAKELLSIFPRPEENDNVILEQYNSYLQKADTSLRSRITFFQYKGNMKPENFAFYDVVVRSTRPLSARGLENNILKVDTTDVIRNNRKVFYELISQQEKSINNRLAKTDSILTLYSATIKPSDSKYGDGTNIFMSNQSGTLNALDLLKHQRELENEKNRINREKYSNDQIITLMNSGLSRSSLKSRGLMKQYALIALGLGFILLLFFSSNSYIQRKGNELLNRK